MTERTYGCNDIALPYAAMKQLREAGQLNLGIDQAVAASVAQGDLMPKKQTVGAAFYFWSWIAVAVFLVSIYFSFTDSWWWFIPGIIAMRIIWGANKQGNAGNLMDLAMDDPDFYDKLRDKGLWLYQVEEDAAEPYLRN